MISVLTILLFTLLQLIAGFGILTLFNIQLKPGLFLSLSMLLGVAVFSLVPFILQLFYIPLTSLNIFLSLVIACITLNIKFRNGLHHLKIIFQNTHFKIRLYEIPFLTLITIIVLISVWRCFYMPPTPRDLNSGAEVIAEYAVHEGTMINSVFAVNLETTNNVFKPPFIICLQIIYKLAGFPFGQLWLSTVFISFVIFLYHAVSATVHRLVTGLLIICFLAIPEMYAYTFMVLFDYSNAVFFFLSLYFLFIFFANKQTGYLTFAGLLMGIATYIRSETLVLACLVIPAITWNNLKSSDGFKKWVIICLIFLAPTLICYFICVPVYVNHYLPIKYNIQNQVNPHLLNLKPLLTRFIDVNRELIFSKDGITYYGYFIFIFVFALALEIIFSRRFTRAGKNWLYAVLVIYIGLPILGYLLPLLDLDNSTKRGLFKVFPLMLLYMANNGLLIKLSERITKWEMANSN